MYREIQIYPIYPENSPAKKMTLFSIRQPNGACTRGGEDALHAFLCLRSLSYITVLYCWKHLKFTNLHTFFVSFYLQCIFMIADPLRDFLYFLGVWQAPTQALFLLNRYRSGTF